MSKGEFSLAMTGRCGYITYQEGDKRLEIYVEYSGRPEADLIVATEDFNRWTSPANATIEKAKRAELLDQLQAWAAEQSIKLDIGPGRDYGE